MTAKTHTPQTTSNAIFQWRSLKTRVTIFTLAFFLVGIWALALYSSYRLRIDMEHALGEQQFSTVSILASGINDEIEDRLKTLEMIAAKITPAMLGNARSTQTFLESQISLKRLFNYGGLVTRLDNITIAEVPIAGRIGINYGDREWIIEALKGRTMVGRPVMGKKSKAPALMMVAPIRDTKDKVIGVLTGATDLAKPNFLTKITDNSYGKTGGFLLISRPLRTIVYATDKKRIMEVLPAPGINPEIDRFIQGYEGSTVLVNPFGVEVLASAKGIPASGWYLAAIIPIEEAIAPIRALQKSMMLAAIFMTLLVGSLIWWMLKRQLAPVFTTIKTLTTLSAAEHTVQPLPIIRRDEIGELIGGFNHLLATLEQQKEALKVSEAQLLAILNATPFPIALVDVNDNIINFWSRSALTLFGHTAPTASEWFQIAYPDTDYQRDVIDRWKPSLEKARLSGQAVNAGVYRISCRDGSVRICELYAAFLADRLIVTFNDITERKRAEDEIRKLNAELEQRVVLRTAELAERTRQMETFTYSVSHDLKAPLRGIDGYSRLLMEDYSGRLDDEGRTFLKTIRQATDQMRQLIEDLLAYSRMERRSLASNKVHPLALVQTLLAERSEDIHACGISVTLNMPDVVVKADPDGLAQVLRNLLDNALKFTGKTPDPQIEIGGQEKEKSCVLWVRDNGIGFDMRYHDRIFEIFQRLHPMEDYPGTGIGMAIVLKAMERMGGRVWAESAPGKGAAFYLEVPK